MKSLHQRLGSQAKVRDSVELNVEDTVQYDSYKEKLLDADMFPILDKKPEATP